MTHFKTKLPAEHHSSISQKTRIEWYVTGFCLLGTKLGRKVEGQITE